MEQRKSSTFIRLLFFLALLIIAVVGSVTYKTTKNLSESSDLIMHTYVVNVELEQILSYLKDAETGKRGYIITNDSLYLEPYLNSRELINNSFVELRELTKDSEAHQKDLRLLNKLINKRLIAFEKAVSLVAENDMDDPKFQTVFLDGQKIMDSIRSKVGDMIAHENRMLSERQQAYENQVTLTPIFLFLLLIISIGLVLLAYYKVTKDVKELKSANEELELFNELTNQSEIIGRHGYWIWHIEDNRYTYSDNLYRLLGEQPQSFEPSLKNFMSFVHPDDLDKLQADVETMMEEQYLPFIHYRIIQKNGNIKHLKAYGQLIEINGEKQIIGTTSDVTDEIENLKLLEERNQELERNNKELSAFNHVASHDLQEPLRKIQTFISRLVEKEKDHISESGKRDFSRIQSAASRMRLLIDDLLQFSRTNKAEKVMENTNINLLLEGAKQDLAEVISESKAIIKSDSFPVMEVIPFQIQQLFANLISNSIKYQQPDTIPEITIHYERINALDDPQLLKPKKEFYHKITVSDNGIGFDNQYAEKIFVLFNRLHGKQDYSGTGIGLSICKKIMDNHNGFIFAKGEEGKGATFEVYLPI